MVLKQPKFKKNKNYFINHLYYNKCFNHFKVISFFHINYPTNTTLKKITTLFKKYKFFVKTPKNVELYEILNNTKYKNISFLINSNTLIVYHPSKIKHLFLLPALINKAIYISPQGIKYPEIMHLTTLYENRYISYSDIVKLLQTYKLNYSILKTDIFTNCNTIFKYNAQWLIPMLNIQRTHYLKLYTTIQTLALSKIKID